MVDWKLISEKWNQLSPDMKKRITDLMNSKFREDPDKFTAWLKEDPYRQTVWSNYIARPAAVAEEAEARRVEQEELKATIEENRELIKTAGVPITPTKAPAPPTRPPTVSIPPARRGLTAADINKLQDEYSDVFFRGLGRVPPNSLATFRVEVERVRDKTFQEAEEHVLSVAKEIVAEFQARQMIPRAAPRMPTAIERAGEAIGLPSETGGGVPMGRVPPAQFPSYPLCYMMPFPRGPCSEEKLKLWDVFCYQMQEFGYDCMTFQRQFDEYIGGTQFLSWDDLRTKFNIFLETISKGLTLPPLFTWRGVPIPTGLVGEIQERLPLEKLEDLVTHYSSVVIRNARSRGDVPTLEDLKLELVEHNIIPESTDITELKDAAKTALTHALERKDVWVAGISATEINDFLSTA